MRALSTATACKDDSVGGRRRAPGNLNRYSQPGRPEKVCEASVLRAASSVCGRVSFELSRTPPKKGSCTRQGHKISIRCAAFRLRSLHRTPAASKSPLLHMARRALNGKVYFSYEDIHDAVSASVARVKAFRPDVIVAIGGGGFIPARMLRTEVKVPIVAVGLELYDDSTNTINENGVQIKQWFSTEYGPGALVENGRVLVVDEVDDTRTTLAACVAELRKRHSPAEVGCLVVHNKLKAKRASLPSDVTYIACEDVKDEWNCYPWDAAAYGLTARQHARRASVCRGGGVDKTFVVGASCAFLGALVATLRR